MSLQNRYTGGHGGSLATPGDIGARGCAENVEAERTWLPAVTVDKLELRGTERR